MASQWPRVVNWMLTTLPTLQGWGQVQVFDGEPITGDNPAAYCTVGYVQDDIGGSTSLAQNADGFTWDETGAVRSQLVVNSGDTTLSTVRGQAFALADAFEANVRGDRTLGGTLSRMSQVDTAVEVLSVQNQQGTSQALVLTLNYVTNT